MYGLELVLFTLLGLAAGSFLTLVVERFDTIESIWVGRSHCNHCKRPLKWWELLPFMGYFLVRGKCTTCDKTIPANYPIFEAATGLTFLLLRLSVPQPINYGYLFIELIIASLLLVLLFYDVLHQEFPGEMLYLALGVTVIGALTVSLAFSRFVPHFIVEAPILSWLTTPQSPFLIYLLGGGVGALFLGLLAVPSKGRWMGYGDVFLGGILGLWVGYPLIILALVIAFYSGAAVGIYLLLSKKLRDDHRLPFGPFLIFGALVAQVWGKQLFYAILRAWGI